MRQATEYPSNILSARSCYNFVKPHMALEGQTPAQRAEINLPKGKGKWLDLLEFAIANQEKTS
jgi:hypothetical protein